MQASSRIGSVDGRGGGIVRDVLRLAAEALAVGVFVSLVLGLAAFVVANQARAATPSPTGPRQGTLLFRSPGGDLPAPLLATDVEITVTGMVARTRVTQRFHNPGMEWLEAIYVFPLPEGAAVDHLDMQVGDRRIEGQIRERRAAQQAYAQARQEGRKATLVEQQRPNLFTTSVANIGPDEDIVVSLEYQESAHFDNGAFRLRFPMALTPRYSPASATSYRSADASAAINDTPPDPPVAPRSTPVNPTTLRVMLDPGFALGTLQSTYHDVHIEEAPGHRYTVTLDGPVPADRDFELVWKPDVGAAPGAALFAQRQGATEYALLMVIPPPAETPAARQAREVVFIIDTSGSMEGSSIRQAKDALDLALDRLQSGDSFNVIAFDSVTRTLFAAPLPVDAASIGRAHAFVRALRAQGGTEMRPALEAALSATSGAGSTPGPVRQVVFLTDGAVGNEAELLAFITAKLGDRRLFTVGIGSAPNAWFMTKAAQYGRGTFTYIGEVSEVQAKMAALLRKLEAPVLTDVAITWPGAAETYPQRIPDLYAGEPITVSAAFAAGMEGDVQIRARRGGVPWTATLPVLPAGTASGLDAVWARAKIETLTDALHGGANETDIRASVLEVALAHHLASAYTSLVAVDVTPTLPAGESAASLMLPVNRPYGAGEEILGVLPQTATPAALQMLLGVLALVAAAVLRGRSRYLARSP